MEVGGGRGRLYTYPYTVTTRIIPALRWAEMRAIFNVLLIVKDKVTDCPQTTTFREKGKPKRIRTEVSLLTNLTLGQTGSRLALFFFSSVRSMLLYAHRVK